jgi:hypothetical protein
LFSSFLPCLYPSFLIHCLLFSCGVIYIYIYIYIYIILFKFFWGVFSWVFFLVCAGVFVLCLFSFFCVFVLHVCMKEEELNNNKGC